MGCIVNGPGEMADADFGYVGGAPGKIDLYVGKVPSLSYHEQNICFTNRNYLCFASIMSWLMASMMVRDDPSYLQKKLFDEFDGPFI